MFVLYRIFIDERRIFLLLSTGLLAYGLFLLNKYLSIREYSHFWWKCWLLSIAFLVIAFSEISPSSFLSIHKKTAEFLRGFFQFHFQKIAYFVAFILIILSGIFFRLYRLDYFPWGLEGLQIDTAYVSEYALSILVEDRPYTPLGYSMIDFHDTLPYYYIALFFSLFGTKLFIFRCAALSIGIINVVLTYFVIKSITNSIIVSLAGMALLAFSAVDTVLNYNALECNISTPIFLSSFLLVNLVIREFGVRSSELGVNGTKNLSIYFIIAGLCFGLGLSSSKYFILLAPCIILMFIHYAAFNLQRAKFCYDRVFSVVSFNATFNLKRVKSLAKGMAFFFLAVFYVISPKLICLWYHHTAYFRRLLDVTTLDSSFKDRGMFNAACEFFSGIKSTITLLFFKTTMVNNWFIGDNPIIDQLILPLFFIGVIYAIVKIKDYKYFFLLCYFALSVCLNASSYPADYRCIMFMPLPYIIAAVTLNLVNWFSRFKKLLYMPVGIYLLLIIFFNIKMYYEGMRVNPAKSHYRVENVILGKYLSENPPDKKTYISAGITGFGMKLFNCFNKTMVDFTKLTDGVQWRWYNTPCNDTWYHAFLSNVRKIINDNRHREESLLLIFDDAPCNEEVVSRLESVFNKNRSELSIYSKSCKDNLIYSTFELGKDESMLVESEDIFPPYDDKTHPALKESPDAKLVGGIVGKYYEGVDLTRLVSARVDKEINFNWGTDRPHHLLPVDGFSVKWDGFIKIDRDGEYWFITESDDGVRLWIDGELVIDNRTNHPLEEDMARINLMKGWHTIRLEYYESLVVATIKLFWKCEDWQKSIIPSDHLCCTSP